MSVDISIWKLVAADDEGAYCQLYRYLFGHLFNYGAKFTENHVLLEDSVQETLLLIWDKRIMLPELKYPETYFFSAFRNILFAKLTKEKGQRKPEMKEPEFSIEQMIIEKEIDAQLKDKLRRATTELTSRQREAIFLRFYKGLSYDNVAVVLGISTKATYKIIARAIQKLKEVMAGAFIMAALLSL